jgi:hypothetical protein
MSAFLEGIGAILGKVCQWIPGRIEHLKDEKIKLEKERDSLEGIKMDINNPTHRKMAARLTVVLQRIHDIDGLLGNNAKG